MITQQPQDLATRLAYATDAEVIALSVQAHLSLLGQDEYGHALIRAAMERRNIRPA